MISRLKVRLQKAAAETRPPAAFFRVQERGMNDGEEENEKENLKVTYQSKAEARAQAGGIPVFCAFDKLMDPKDLVGNPRNPNQHPKDQVALLAHIIQSQGWRAPITVSNQSGYVVRGHGRLAAALLFERNTSPWTIRTTRTKRRNGQT